jgi:uncharacterized protein (TIGR03437 family)
MIAGRLLTILVLAPIGAARAQPGGGQQWFSAWTAAQDQRIATSMSGTSVRMIVRPTISGTAVRVRLENRFGTSPVVFSAAYIGQVQSGAALVPGSNMQLLFNGSAGLTLARGASAYSDPLTFPVAAFTRYAISIDVTTSSDINAHSLGLVTNYMAVGAHAADSTANGFTAVPNEDAVAYDGPTFPVYWVAAVDVGSSSNTGTVVTLGDSITDGFCSTRTNQGAFDGVVVADQYNRWPDLLAMRLAGLPATQTKSVANEGISGNTVVAPPLAGLPAVDRLGNDVLIRAGATHVIFLEGTNDIGTNNATSATVIAGDQQVIDNGHAAGLKIIGATLLPRGGEGAWTSTQEQQRLAVNDWIRHQANFDGLIDFDTLMKGSVNAKSGIPEIPPKWGCWDGVHPNAAGYAAMAAFIDLSLFATPGSAPVIRLVANAEGENATIAPNTWVEIKGSNLAPAGDSRIWKGSDFVNSQMPTQLDGVEVTVNGKSAYVYYISPTQVDILTPPDPMQGLVEVRLTSNGVAGSPVTVQAQPLSPSFFIFGAGPYVAAEHIGGSYLGPASMSVPGYSFTPAKPGETVVLYANGFGPASMPLVSGSVAQSGTLSPLPALKIGGIAATVTFAGLIGPGEFQFNVVVPASLADGDQPIAATYNGLTTQSGTLISVKH